MSAHAQVGVKQNVPQMPSPAPAPFGTLQRKCSCGGMASNGGECESCKKKKALQRQAAGSAGPAVAPPIVHQVLRSPGRPLDPGTRAFFEPRFGHDFSKVRIHSDAEAAASARMVNALAYTAGSQIVFAQGHYRPAEPEGRRLLAHELTHVVQQPEGGENFPSLRVGEIDSPFEREADNIAGAVVSNRLNAAPARSGTPLVQRQQAPGGNKGTTNYHFQNKSGFDVCIYCACSGQDTTCGDKVIGKVTTGKCPPGKRVDWEKKAGGCTQNQTDLAADPCPDSTHICQ
jgi:uncharacterized protein DUF4157